MPADGFVRTISDKILREFGRRLRRPEAHVLNEPATSGRFSSCQSRRSWATLGEHKPDLVRTMPISVSTDPIRPTERQAFWTEAICRSFANIETKPLGSTVVSGHF